MSGANPLPAGDADRGQAFINALRTQRNQAQDDLAATAAELAVERAARQKAEAVVLALNAELQKLKAQKTEG